MTWNHVVSQFALLRLTQALQKEFDFRMETEMLGVFSRQKKRKDCRFVDGFFLDKGMFLEDNIRAVGLGLNG